MGKPEISDFDPEFLWLQLERETLNANYWYQKYKKLEREITLIQRVLDGVMTEAKQ